MTSRGLAEIVLIVEDVPAAARFYEDVVGLTPAHRENNGGAGSSLNRLRWFVCGRGHADSLDDLLQHHSEHVNTVHRAEADE